MAKVKSMNNRNYIGQMGGAVFYMNKGQNIARELAASVSNPRTEAQQTQRMRWANLVGFYRSNLPWMKRGAFESKKQTWSDYNAFVSANAGVSPVFLTKEQAAQGGAVVAPYIVTRGSLPTVTLTSDDGNDQFVTDLYVGDLPRISGTTTAAALSAALLENNNALQEGDQISAILNYQRVVDGTPYILARYYEFIIDSTDTRTLADLGLDGVFLTDTWYDNECLTIVTDGAACGAACVVSRTTSGNIKVSTQSLELNAAMTSLLTNYTSDAAYQQAANSYGESEANFLAAGYSGLASNVAVPVVQSILSVTIGDETFTNAADIGSQSNFGDTTPYPVSVLMSQPPTEVTEVHFVVTTPQDTEDSISLMPVTVSGNTIVCDSTAFNNDLGQVPVIRLEVTVDGETYTL